MLLAVGRIAEAAVLFRAVLHPSASELMPHALLDTAIAALFYSVAAKISPLLKCGSER